VALSVCYPSSQRSLSFPDILDDPCGIYEGLEPVCICLSTVLSSAPRTGLKPLLRSLCLSLSFCLRPAAHCRQMVDREKGTEMHICFLPFPSCAVFCLRSTRYVHRGVVGDTERPSCDGWRWRERVQRRCKKDPFDNSSTLCALPGRRSPTSLSRYDPSLFSFRQRPHFPQAPYTISETGRQLPT